MPNENEIPQFIPEKSAAAKRISALSDEELSDRYFVTTNDPNWQITEDATNALELKNKNTNRYRFEKTRSLNGEPLNYFVTMILVKIRTYIPDGYKLNMANIFADLEAILSENSEQARTISMTNTVTDFFCYVTKYFVVEANRGLGPIRNLNANANV